MKKALQPFDYTDALDGLTRQIVRACPEFGHIQPERVLVCYTQSRTSGLHGLYAACHPLRFEGGSLTAERRGRTFLMPRVFRSTRRGSAKDSITCEYEEGTLTLPMGGCAAAGGSDTSERTEILYVICFALPRFADLSFETKLTTVFHELYHISPEFNGDIRRFPGGKYAHGHSRKKFNQTLKAYADAFLLAEGAREAVEFLRSSFDELVSRHGGVVGRRVRIPRPKPI